MPDECLLAPDIEFSKSSGLVKYAPALKGEEEDVIECPSAPPAKAPAAAKGDGKDKKRRAEAIDDPAQAAPNAGKKVRLVKDAVVTITDDFEAKGVPDDDDHAKTRNIWLRKAQRAQILELHQKKGTAVVIAEIRKNATARTIKPGVPVEKLMMADLTVRAGETFEDVPEKLSRSSLSLAGNACGSSTGPVSSKTRIPPRYSTIRKRMWALPGTRFTGGSRSSARRT